MTLWTAAHQAPPSTGFSRQDHWSGVPCPDPGNPALAEGSFTTQPPGEQCLLSPKETKQAFLERFGNALSFKWSRDKLGQAGFRLPGLSLECERPFGVSPWAQGFSMVFVTEHMGSPPPGRVVLHRALAR